MKGTMELKNLESAINKYIEKHNGDVSIVVSVMAYKGKDCNIVDDAIFIRGVKDCLKLDLNELLKIIKKEKDEFIC